MFARRSLLPSARGRALRIATKRLALALVASPAVMVACLFVVRPEALGAPATKLALMAAAGCLLVALGELSDALTRWMLPRLEARVSAVEAQPAMFDVLTAAPPSTRFG